MNILLSYTATIIMFFEMIDDLDECIVHPYSITLGESNAQHIHKKENASHIEDNILHSVGDMR